MDEKLEKIYFLPGDIVVLKHENIYDKPNMLVTEIVTSRLNQCYNPPNMVYYGNISATNTNIATQSVVLRGIKCGWFDLNHVWREQIFSTKDLIKLENIGYEEDV